ncbi:MAG TPA: SiaC family regulatory phosphoprotein, partial [Spirochaetota bacterium]|nr:SiaC family regulatory phosphoprotein [Spirochaetota bacterium]
SIKLITVSESNVILRAEGDIVSISGNIECEKPDKFMTPFFNEVHNEILLKGMKEIKLDIRKLGFLNSSGIKELVDWINKLNDLNDNEKYVITVLTNPDYLWQESSITTLGYLNPQFIKRVSI